MKIDLLSKVIELKSEKKEFSIITDLQTAKNYVYDPDCKLDKDLEDFKINIKESFTNRKDGMIKDTNLFIKNYFRPIQVVIVGAVHIAQYFVEFAKSLNINLNTINGGWKTNLEVRSEKDWEDKEGRSVSFKIKNE